MLTDDLFLFWKRLPSVQTFLINSMVQHLYRQDVEDEDFDESYIPQAIRYRRYLPIQSPLFSKIELIYNCIVRRKAA